MPAIKEYDIQRALMLWLDGTPATRVSAARPGVLRPDVICFHTPNGGSRRDAAEGKRLKDIGVRAGIYDLTFLGDSRFWVLELKDADGKLSDVQIAMWSRYQATGAAGIAWANNLGAAKAQIVAWGLTVNAS